MIKDRLARRTAVERVISMLADAVVPANGPNPVKVFVARFVAQRSVVHGAVGANEGLACTAPVRVLGVSGKPNGSEAGGGGAA